MGPTGFCSINLSKSIERRPAYWKRDLSSPEAYVKSVEPNRKALARMLGVVDERIPFDAPELIDTTKQSALLAEGASYKAYAVRWPVLGGIHGEGIFLEPTSQNPVANIIAVPDADQTPEQLCGLIARHPAEVAVRPCARGKRLPGLGACAYQSAHGKTPRPGEPHEPRIPLPQFFRNGPHADRLRSPKNPRRRRLVPKGKPRCEKSA